MTLKCQTMQSDETAIRKFNILDQAVIQNLNIKQPENLGDGKHAIHPKKGGDQTDIIQW